MKCRHAWCAKGRSAQGFGAARVAAWRRAAGSMDAAARRRNPRAARSCLIAGRNGRRRSRPSERFRIRPRPPRSRTGRSGRSFVPRAIAKMTQVRAGLGRASRRGNPHDETGPGVGQVRRRPASAAIGPGRHQNMARDMILGSTWQRAVQTYLRYIARDDVTPHGAPGVAYYSQGEHTDLNTFARGRRADLARPWRAGRWRLSRSWIKRIV